MIKPLTDSRKILRLVREAVHLEHDPVRGGALAGQRHLGGQQSRASDEASGEAAKAREPRQGAEVTLSSDWSHDPNSGSHWSGSEPHGMESGGSIF